MFKFTILPINFNSASESNGVVFIISNTVFKASI